MSKTRKCTASLNKSKGDEFEVIEYEEVILSDVEDDESFTREASYCKKNVDSRSLNSKQNKNDTTSFSDSCTSMDIEKLTDRPFKKVARKPARPIRLFSFTDHDIIDKFSLTDPAKKNLTMQLLDIVKSVNSNRKLKLEKSGAVIPNFYIMATKQDLSDQTRKIISMKSGDIVSLIKEVVHMIKACVYREVDDIEIICDSPAIFLIKYVNVKNWDSTMNAVYVVTSEYLLPYLCKIRAAQEQEKNSKLIVASISKEVRKKPKNPVHIAKKPKIEHQTKKEVEIYKPSKETFSQDVICPHTDEEMIESILSKYLEREAVDFFLTQVKTSGKFGNRFRWSEKDKFFALNLLRKNPTEYSILYEKYCLPSDKTIDKFLKQIKHERIDDIKIEDE